MIMCFFIEIFQFLRNHPLQFRSISEEEKGRILPSLLFKIAIIEN